MAHKLAIKLDATSIVNGIKLATKNDGTYFSYRTCFSAKKITSITSNCKYFNNPGFVCPLSAYREPGLFQING